MKKVLLLIIVMLTIGGCGSKGPESALFVREGLDLSYVNRVAVLPFENLTGSEFAARRIRDITLTEVMSSNRFEVVDKGIVDTALKEMALGDAQLIDAPLLKILGKRLDVNVFLSGTINNIGGGERGRMAYPEISLTLYLIDSETAQVLWRSTAYRNGYSIWNRLFDLDPKDEFEVTLNLLQDMIAAMPQ